MSSSKVEPVRKSVVVNLGVERAFALFINKFDAIKPREHNLLSVPIAKSVFEPRVGGHIYDVGIDGSRCEWARGAKALVVLLPRRSDDPAALPSLP